MERRALPGLRGRGNMAWALKNSFGRRYSSIEKVHSTWAKTHPKARS